MKIEPSDSIRRAQQLGDELGITFSDPRFKELVVLLLRETHRLYGEVIAFEAVTKGLEGDR